MVEDIGKTISKGFGTYTENLNLGIPFILNLFITVFLAIILLGLGFFYIFGSTLSALENASTPQQFISILLPAISKHLFEVMVLIILYFVIALFFQSFFTAGAIGMAKHTTETGKSELSTMIDAGKRNVINLYFAQILVGLLFVVGIVFLVPGALKADLNQLSSSANSGAILLLSGGFLLWIVYMLILSLILAVYRYSLVVDNLGPVDGILAGIGFFSRHKFDVFIIWLIAGVIVMVLTIIGQFMSLIPIISVIWPIISMLISVLVISPLTTVWWVRLYMAHTDKKLYFNELLAHPNDLEKL